MTFHDAFKEFCTKIEIDNYDEINKSVQEIVKKLNKEYYNLEDDGSSNSLLVGSMGRNTAIKNNSDIDLLFILPQSIYEKYDNYDSNGQSSLLQELKNVLLARYPKTDISGDGQVVDIEFEKFTVELVPAFKQIDGGFLYPDTHDGGTWQIANPTKEIECANVMNNDSNGTYINICKILRSWKNANSFIFSGILIDTLVYNHFMTHEKYTNYDYENYIEILKEIFKEFSQFDKHTDSWYAMGSNSRIEDAGGNEFIDKAKQSYEDIKSIYSCVDENLSILQDVLGIDFPTLSVNENIDSKHKFIKGGAGEEFIENLYPVDIRYRLKIDCEVSQNGFRPFMLSESNMARQWLSKNRTLKFFIKNTNCRKPYNVKWKIRNVGYVAKMKNMIRGEIIDDSEQHKEHTDFYGPHYVECYLIKNGICVARDRIEVPISNA